MEKAMIGQGAVDFYTSDTDLVKEASLSRGNEDTESKWSLASPFSSWTLVCSKIRSVGDKAYKDQSNQLAQEIFSSWISFVNLALTKRIDHSLRVPEINVSLRKFWEDLYKRERQLTIAQMFSSSAVDGFKVSFENIASGSKYCKKMCGCRTADHHSRQLVIHWLRAIVNKMGWKESTFFITIHILDSYITSLKYNREHGTNENDGSRCCKIAHICFRQFLPSAPPGFNWWLSATAALYLAVVVEEEHTQIYRARKILIGPFFSIIAQVNRIKINILSRLTAGFLITRTPEDFLYYFLANMRNSSKFVFIYERLFRFQPENVCEQICQPSVCDLEFLKNSRVGESRKSENSFYFSPWTIPFRNLDACASCCLSTLSGVVRFVLFSSFLAFAEGLYCVVPSSRITAVCLFLSLVLKSSPELNTTCDLIDDFCRDVFHFHDSRELLLSISFCLPLLQQAASDMLRKKNCGVSSYSNCFFEPFSSFLEQFILIVTTYFHKRRLHSISGLSVTDCASQSSTAETVTTISSCSQHLLHDSQSSSEI